MLDALIEHAPPSLKLATPASALRRVSLRPLDDRRSGSQGARVTPRSSDPAGETASGLADTVSATSGVSPLVAATGSGSRPATPAATTPGAMTPAATAPSPAEACALPGRRRWQLALAPGVALLLGTVAVVMLRPWRGGASDAAAPAGVAEHRTAEGQAPAAAATPPAAATAVAAAAPGDAKMETARSKADSPKVEAVARAGPRAPAAGPIHASAAKGARGPQDMPTPGGVAPETPAASAAARSTAAPPPQSATVPPPPPSAKPGLSIMPR
jgi:hypothetical protein